ncbi:aminopeptidase [Candidatus Woesearchaeota archaeon]|nr:aminopeptidase [Candidatus Woesearchaeota archaeon]
MFNIPAEWINKVERNVPRFYKIIKGCLNVKKEQVLVISDHGLPGKHLSTLMGYGYYQAAKQKGLRVQLLYQQPKKSFMPADEHVMEALQSLPKESVVVVAVSQKLGRIGQEKSFRSFCEERGHRFISTTGLADAATSNFDLFMEAMNVNYARLQKKGLQIKKRWDKAKEIRVTTPAGTDVTFNVMGMKAVANIGLYHEKGRGGNIPSGEVYIPPKGTTVNGMVMIDGSLKTDDGTILVKEPVTLKIVNGRIVKMEGKTAPLLEKTFVMYEKKARYPERVRFVGELSVGINSGAVLLGSTIMDEKVLGTGHIGIGSNYWFGGTNRTIYHADQVFKSPTFYLDGKKMEM